MEQWRIYPVTPESGAAEIVRHRVADQWLGIEVEAEEDFAIRNEGESVRDSEIVERNFHFVAHPIGGERLSKERQEKLARTIAGSFALPKGWETRVRKDLSPRAVRIDVTYRLKARGHEPMTIGTLTSKPARDDLPLNAGFRGLEERERYR